jgi:hypothetical protein
MRRVQIDAGICGFSTSVSADSPDGQMVNVAITSECPHVTAGAADLGEVDAYKEIFSKPHETATYAALSPHLPHVACPVYAGVLKCIEASASLALPKDSTITFVEEES